MTGEEREGKLRIPKQLFHVRNAVLSRIADNVENKLEQQGLLDNEGNPVEPLNEENLNLLSQNLFTGVHAALSHAKLNVPIGYGIDEVSLTDSLSSGLGEAEVEVDNKDIRVRFTGKNPMVTKVTSPLKPDPDPNARNGESVIRRGTITGYGFMKEFQDFKDDKSQ